MTVASDESYRDPTNLQGKLREHQAFEDELTAYNGQVNAVKMVQTPYVCIIIRNNISIYNYLNVHTHMYKLGLDDIGIYCHNTYFIAKSITVLL